MKWNKGKMLVILMGIILIAVCAPSGSYRMEGRFDEEGYFLYQGIPTSKEFEGLTQEQAMELAKEYMDRQGDAWEASGRLTNMFKVGEEGTWIYPQEYAGSYVDNYVLHICLTKTDSETLNPYVMCLGESIKAVCFDKVEYSYRELEEKLYDFLQFLTSKKIAFTEAYVRVEDNSLLIRATQKHTSKIRFWGYINGLKGILSVYESEHAVPEVNLRGGDAIYNTTTGGDFTLGACGMWAGQEAILTAGHCCTSTGQYMR